MGVQQIQVTVTGNLGADPKSFGKSIDAPACSFRVGVTPRYFDGNRRQWRDRETTWVAVRAYRTLATNVLNSLHKGDPVIVTGTLQTERWRKEGETVDRITPVIDAVAIGHDLSQGIGRFRRVGREQPAANGQGNGFGVNGVGTNGNGYGVGVTSGAGMPGGSGIDPFGSAPSNDPMPGAGGTGGVAPGTNIPGLNAASASAVPPVDLGVDEPADGADADDGATTDDSPADALSDESIDTGTNGSDGASAF